MELRYRQANKGDSEIIANLAERIWKSHYIKIITMAQIEYMLRQMYSPESLAAQIDEGHVFTLAFLNDELVGYISFSTKDNQHFFIHKFYIDTDKQRTGLGGEIFRHELSTRMKDAVEIELTVNRRNYTAINFYFKNGFTIKDAADFDIGNGYMMNDFVMVKKIG